MLKAASVLVVATTLCRCHLGKTRVGGVVHIEPRHFIKAYDGLILSINLFLRLFLNFILKPAGKLFVKTRARQCLHRRKMNCYSIGFVAGPLQGVHGNVVTPRAALV